jgi:pseudaminic acid synthase
MKDITIAGRAIGLNQKPFIIAEMSGNHNQSLERAFEIVDEAAKSGADAIKLQTYTADTLTMKGVVTINDKDSLWDGRELHDLYKEAYTPWEWHKEIFDYAKEKGLIAFSSPFDESAVDFLEELNVPAYKIASFENSHIPLLIKVAQTGKPIIVSTGVATIAEVDECVRTLKEYGATEIILLKCTSTYPATPENTNLLTIPHLALLHNSIVGLSDHTMGIGASIAAIALGARVIEKHFCLSREQGGVDSAFSLEPSELTSLVVESERAFLSLGKIKYGVQDAEVNSVKGKRSIYVKKAIKKGDILSDENLQIIRPAHGLSPKYWYIVIGRVATEDLKIGTPLSWDNV